MKTIKDYTLTFKHYGEITVPAGTPLTHITAMGYDKNYHFVGSYVWIEKNYPEIANILNMDVSTYGINVPIEYTSEYIPPFDADKINELSKEFSRVINEWCTPDQLAEIIRRNASSEYKEINCCATHDFYDSNMAMDEAFTKVFAREFTFWNDEEPETEKQNSIDIYYFNAAWDLSKANNFTYPLNVNTP